MRQYQYIHVPPGDRVRVRFADIESPMFEVEVNEPGGEGSVVLAVFFKGNTAKGFVREAKLALNQMEDFIRRKEGKNGTVAREEGRQTAGNGR